MGTRSNPITPRERRPSGARRTMLLLLGLALVTVAAFFIHDFTLKGQRYQPTSLQHLGDFEFDEISGTLTDVPEDHRALDGRHVHLDGFMWAPDALGPRVSDFQLVYDVTNHHRPPRVQERVFAHVPNGTVVYYGDMAGVDGTLHLNIKRDADSGKAVTLFTMDVDGATSLAPHPGEIWSLVWLSIPALITVLLLALAGWLLRKFRRLRRHAMGLCINCGYDLRASHGRCPECGSHAPSPYDFTAGLRRLP